MIPWWILGVVAFVGLVSLVAGLWVSRRVRADEEGETRVCFGIAAIAAALIVALGKALDLYARMRGWW